MRPAFGIQRLLAEQDADAAGGRGDDVPGVARLRQRLILGREDHLVVPAEKGAVGAEHARTVAHDAVRIRHVRAARHDRQLVRAAPARRRSPRSRSPFPPGHSTATGRRTCGSWPPGATRSPRPPRRVCATTTSVRVRWRSAACLSRRTLKPCTRGLAAMTPTRGGKTASWTPLATRHVKKPADLAAKAIRRLEQTHLLLCAGDDDFAQAVAFLVRPVRRRHEADHLRVVILPHSSASLLQCCERAKALRRTGRRRDEIEQ